MSTALSSTQTAAPAFPEAGAAQASFPRGRSSWSGLLKISLVTIPVKAYPAATTTKEVAFNQLHVGCGQRIRYEKHCPVHGKVDAGAIVSGYQYAPDQYVVIEEAELDQLRPAKDKALLLEQFVGPEQVDPLLFSGRTLYLVPDGLAAQHAFAVLTQTLVDRRKWALGRVTLSGHRQLALVRPFNRLMALHLLHYPAQLRASTALEADLACEQTSDEERKLAALLMDTNSQPLVWSKYTDDSAEQLKAIVEAKLKGRTLEPPAAEEVPVLRLLDALKQSVAAAQKDASAVSPSRKGRKTRRSA